MVTRRKMPMKWSEGKPRQPGFHVGTIYGHPFEVTITNEQLHSQRTVWEYDLDFEGHKYGNTGTSGGVQRALSCLRDQLEGLCDDHGIDEPDRRVR